MKLALTYISASPKAKDLIVIVYAMPSQGHSHDGHFSFNLYPYPKHPYGRRGGYYSSSLAYFTVSGSS